MDESNHIGKRIRFFRERRGLSQRYLGELSGIIEATIRKYEIGQRNPKPDQIAKIAEALGITPNALSPTGIETDADVVSLILAIDDRVGITFDGKKDSKGKIDPKTLTLHIDDLFVNDALARYGNAKNHLEKLRTTNPPTKEKEAHQELLEEFEAALAEEKLNLLMSSKVIGKNRSDITVKLPPDYSPARSRKKK